MNQKTNKSEAKLWGARFAESASSILEEFNASITYDWKLFREDIRGSKAHSKMLCSIGILSQEELEDIHSGLDTIEAEIAEQGKAWAQARISDEDIHLAVERRLTEIIGDTAKKLHTARSRNDQVVTDLRLWLKTQATNMLEQINKCRKALIERAKTDLELIIPGFTHLQQAQPLSLGHVWLAHEARLARDYDRLADCIKRIDVNPLGSGALAGSTFAIDRELTTKELDFASYSTNSLDAVSDRDFVAEYEFVLSLTMVHLSQFAEEMIAFNSQEFSYITISDSFATGSSMMPQKKNPDIPELIRGKTGRVIGVMNALLVTLKGLPLAYNKDLQEDKEQLFMANDTVLKCLEITAAFIENISPIKDEMEKACKQSYMNATDAAEYLVKKNIPFRDAYKAVGEAVAYAIKCNKFLHQLNGAEWKSFHDAYEADIEEALQIANCIKARNIPGATSFEQVKAAIKTAEEKL